jgi:copper(I)-binding protein
VSRAEHSTPARRRSRRHLATVVPAAAGLGLALLLTGCGAGQITQTDTQVAAVNGANGEVGEMAVRNAELAFPANSAQGVYQPGSTAPLIVTIVNTGLTEDTLIGVSTPAAESVTIDGSPTGSRAIPGGFAVISGRDVDDQDTTGAMTPLNTTSAAAGSAASGTGSASSTTTTGAAGGSGLPSANAPTTGSSATSRTLPSTTAAPALAPSSVRIELVGIKTINGGPLRAGMTIPITFTFAHSGRVTLNVPIAAPADNSTVNSGS